MDKRISCPLTY